MTIFDGRCGANQPGDVICFSLHYRQKIRMTLTFATACSICGGLVDFRLHLRVYHNNFLMLDFMGFLCFVCVWPITPLSAASEDTECLKLDFTGARAVEMYADNHVLNVMIVHKFFLLLSMLVHLRWIF